MAPKKLYRSKKNRLLAGVCGGIGEYFGVDPNLVRLVWIVVCLIPGAGLAGILVYILAALLLPEGDEDESIEVEYRVKEDEEQQG
jgi:phage shock protein C